MYSKKNLIVIKENKKDKRIDDTFNSVNLTSLEIIIL